MSINSKLSDENIEDCIDGSSDIKMLREIIDMAQDGDFVNIEEFADLFAYKIRGFIDAEDDEDYDEAYNNNWEWGKIIAMNINDKLSSVSDNV